MSLKNDTDMQAQVQHAEASAKSPTVRHAGAGVQLGQQVMVDTGEKEYNGSRTFPAIVTRVWSGGSCINVRVIVDGNEMPWLTSICHKSDVTPPSTYRQPRPTYWYWMHESLIS